MKTRGSILVSGLLTIVPSLFLCAASVSSGDGHFYWVGDVDSDYTNPENWRWSANAIAADADLPQTKPTVMPGLQSYNGSYGVYVHFTDKAVTKEVVFGNNPRWNASPMVQYICFDNTSGYHLTGTTPKGFGAFIASGEGEIASIEWTSNVEVGANTSTINGGTLVVNKNSIYISGAVAHTFTGTGTLVMKNPFEGWSGDRIAAVDGSLTLRIESALPFGGTIGKSVTLKSKTAKLELKNTVEGAEAKFDVSKTKGNGIVNGFDTDNYELFATMVDSDHVQIALRQKGVVEGDPFVLGVPSGSGTVEDGITMKCAITGYNTTAPVTLKVFFGLHGETLSQVTSFDVTGDGIFTYTVTDDLEYATKYDYQFVCEGTDGEGEPFVRESVIYSATTPGDFTWVVPAPDEGDTTASDWHVAANWDKNRRPPALGNMTIPNAAIITATESVQAETLSVTGVYQKVTLQPGTYTVASRLQIGSSYEYDYTLWRDRGHAVLELLDGVSLSVGGDLYLERSSGNRLVVNRGANVTGRSLSIPYAAGDGVDIFGATASFSGSLTTTREQFSDRHKGSSTVNIMDGGTLSLGALTLGWNDARVFVDEGSFLLVSGGINCGGVTDGGNDNRIYVTNATVRAGSIGWPNDGRVSNMKFYLVETKPGTASVTTTGNVMIGQSGDQRNAGQNCNNLIALEGGALSIGGSLLVGNYAKPLDHYNNYLQVGGKTARVTANALTAYGDGSIRFKMPTGGFDAVPVVVTGDATFNTKTVTDGESERVIETYLDVDFSDCPSFGRFVLLTAGSVTGLTTDRVRITPYRNHETVAKITEAGVEVIVKSGFTVVVR